MNSTSGLTNLAVNEAGVVYKHGSRLDQAYIHNTGSSTLYMGLGVAAEGLAQQVAAGKAFPISAGAAFNLRAGSFYDAITLATAAGQTTTANIGAIST